MPTIPALSTDDKLSDIPAKVPVLRETISSCAGRMNQRVRFADGYGISRVPCRNELSPEELDAMWLSENDYAEFLAEIELTEAAMNDDTNHHLVDDHLLCARGLNSLDNLAARAESNHFVQQLILHQIAHQVRQQGTWDVYMVAKVYRDCSQPAVAKAQNLAREDAQDAVDYHFET